LKSKKPKPQLENINIDVLRDYMKSRASFKSKSTTYSSLSRIRSFGDFLVRDGVWIQNPAKWMKGPKLNSSMA
jgi:site-specific recombinase XerD